MEAITIRASVAIFDFELELPTDGEGWTSLWNQAVVLAEFGNSLMIGSRVRNEEE